MLDIWEPWWSKRQPFPTMAIQELDASSDIDYNLNRFGQENVIAEEIQNETKEGSDEGGDDYEDIENDEEEEKNPEFNDESDHQLLSRVYNRRLKDVPDLSTLLKKCPAPTLPFIIASNLTSFLFYSRYYNGNLLDVDPLRITAALIEQLLSIDSQNTIDAEFQSAYFDHLKALVNIGHLSAETISNFQPMIL